MDRCNELCTKETTGQCALCDALAERDRFIQFWFRGGLLRAGIQSSSEGISRGWERLANKEKIPRRWWWLGIQHQLFLSDLASEEWRRQHDEISRTILQVLVVIVTF